MYALNWSFEWEKKSSFLAWFFTHFTLLPKLNMGSIRQLFFRQNIGGEKKINFLLEKIHGYKPLVHPESCELMEVHEYDSTFVHWSWQKQNTKQSVPKQFCCTRNPNYFSSCKVKRQWRQTKWTWQLCLCNLEAGIPWYWFLFFHWSI